MAQPEQSDSAAASVAIIGMTGRFPGARNLEAFWRNLRDGVVSISFFTAEDLEAAGVHAQLVQQPNFVRACGLLEEIDMFDAAFFGYSPRDAMLMDPQQRLFLECAWEVLEQAGYDPAQYKGLIGVYGGASTSSYLPLLYANPEILQVADSLTIAIGNDLPFLTTRVSYKLDLKGPSCPIQTACSTSLVAVHLACQGLLNAECDIALAGGASVRLPQPFGYFYVEGGIFSPDGHCRPFDAKAEGTIFSSGVGIVALKRLEDALADGDSIYAVIRGSAINNDGAQKASFTAPGVSGQTEVIADALVCAEAEADTIDYIETHGTATSLGDSIEIQALKNAYSSSAMRPKSCAIGAVKANIGHLDAAAGIASLIKTVLALRRRQIPPTPHFKSPNPNIPFETTPFYVNAGLAEWKKDGAAPRRAGVSSFGFGGTNAHVIIEEAPQTEPSPPSRTWQLLPLSARSPAALEKATANLAAHLKSHPQVDLADVAYTLKIGRRAFSHRRMAICRSTEDAIAVLEGAEPTRLLRGVHDTQDRSVIFLFPGQGSQRVGMCRELYRDEPAFTQIVDQCAETLQQHLGFDIRDVVYPDESVASEAEQRLTRTAVAQPALFVIEYALARMWMRWGIQPEACLGHSIGEYVAACLSDVLALDDALRLVALRGRLMESMPEGAMLAVPLSATQTRSLLDDRLWLAAVNSPSLCAVSGTCDRISELEEELRRRGLEGRRLRTSHAFHSALMDGAVEPLVETAAQMERRPPKIPYLSNLSGDWVDAAQVHAPAYWGQQMRQTVQFSSGVEKLLEKDGRILLEVGPGQTLTSLVRQHSRAQTSAVISSLPSTGGPQSDQMACVGALGRLWVSGAQIDWTSCHAEERRRRIALPTYPFERQRYWVPAAPSQAGRQNTALARPTGKSPRIDDWFYIPGWTRSARLIEDDPADHQQADTTWLIFADDGGIAERVIQRLKSAGRTVITVGIGEGFERCDESAFRILPSARAGYEAVLRVLASTGRPPGIIMHFWGVDEPSWEVDPAATRARQKELGFDSLLLLTQALAAADAPSPHRMVAVTNGVLEVTGEEQLAPAKAASLGICRVIPQEYPGLSCTFVDVGDCLQRRVQQDSGVIDQLLYDAVATSADSCVAYRGAYRWLPTYQAASLGEPPRSPARLRAQGVYLITGGLGDIGLTIAEHLVGAVAARLILTGRKGLPPEDQWDQYLRDADESDLTGQRIHRIKQLRRGGAEVLVVKADAADASEMRDAVRLAKEQFGAIDGVIHAAGLVSGDQFRPIIQTDRELCDRHFRPKLDALYVLAEALQGGQLDFCMLVSSLSTVLGGLGFSAYASANASMDTFAHQASRSSSFPWIAVNWDSWLSTADEARLRQAQQTPTGYVMTAAEGIEAFRRVLSFAAGPQIVISTGDLQSRIEQWVKMDLLQEGGRAETPASSIRYPRPHLQTEYVAPSDDLERSIAGIWQDLLCVDQVGVYDSFFELGGNSLTGLLVIARMTRQLGARLSAVSLFEAPTVNAMARLIQTKGQDQAPTLDQSRTRGEQRRERRKQRTRADGGGRKHETQMDSD